MQADEEPVSPTDLPAKGGEVDPPRRRLDAAELKLPVRGRDRDTGCLPCP